jgi:hypothetical protein
MFAVKTEKKEECTKWIHEEINWLNILMITMEAMGFVTTWSEELIILGILN